MNPATMVTFKESISYITVTLATRVDYICAAIEAGTSVPVSAATVYLPSSS
jgi:hypothetical protein